MRTRTFQLDARTSQALLAAYQATDDGPYRTRLQAVRLYGLGYPTTEIQDITGSPRSTLLDWVATYQQGGIPALADQRRGGNCRKLTPAQIDEVGRTLRQYTPRSRFGPQAATPDGQTWTLPDLMRLIREEYGVTYRSPTSYLCETATGPPERTSLPPELATGAGVRYAARGWHRACERPPVGETVV